MKQTYCNPLDLGYRYQHMKEGPRTAGFREGADPTLVYFKGRYYLFVSMSAGFWYSDDLLNWNFHADPNLLIYDYAPDVRQVGNYLYFCASRRGRNCPILRTADPLTEPFIEVSAPFAFWDPDLFCDDDGRVYFYWGCSNIAPIYGVELDPDTMTPIGEKQELIFGNETTLGYERPGNNGIVDREASVLYQSMKQFYDPKTGKLNLPPQMANIPGLSAESLTAMFNAIGKPYIEGAFMTKHGDTYYLQYACPGTQYNTYADAPLCNSFSKNAIEERIRAIMKIKKTSKFAVMISAVLVIGVTGGFATSASSLEKNTETAQENGETTVALNEVNIREDEPLSSSDVEWWTAEEYAKWLDEEKEVLQSMIGEKAYTGGDGWFVWTQEKVDETIALYEDNLQKIKDGMKLSKSSDDAVGITMAYSPENIEYAKQEAETVTENKDSNENVFSEEQLSEYAKAGITYQKETGFLMYDGKTIGYFRDEFKPGTYTISSKRGGTLRVEVQRENYGTITDVKAEPLSDDFWSEPAVLVESSGGEAVTADEMKGSVFEEGGSENIAADDMGEYSSEEGKGLNIAVPQEYADYGVSCDAQGNWVYNGKIIADLYDEGRGIFSNSNGTMYIEVTRDKSGKISSFQKVSKNRMQELFTEFNPETETFAEYNSEAKH